MTRNKRPKMTKGKRAELIAEGCQLNELKKRIEDRLDEIKKSLDIKKEGTYGNVKGDFLSVVEIPRYTDLSPKDILDYMKTEDMKEHFFEVVKVQMGTLKKFMPENKMNQFRVELDPSYRFCWK